MYLGALTTIDLSPWANQDTMPVPTSGMQVTCPGAPGCPGSEVSPDQNAILQATAQACTCVNGTCRENGNSCSTSYVPQGPLTAPPASQWITGVSNSTALLIGAGVLGLGLIGRTRR